MTLGNLLFLAKIRLEEVQGDASLLLSIHSVANSLDIPQSCFSVRELEDSELESDFKDSVKKQIWSESSA